MRRVWRCDYCSENTTTVEEMQTHEAECSFNPANRQCYSCRHHESIYGMMDTMEICHAGVDSGMMFDQREDNVPCGQWAEE